MNPQLDFCLVACDEETQLARCLGSARDLCANLLVVDTGSRDNTAGKARELGARVLDFEWVDDFAAARNFALDHLTGDWILMLDADEWLLPEAVPAIRGLLDRDDLVAVNLLRREIGAAQSPWSLVSRLFRRHPAIRFDRPYHAMIDDSVETLLEREPRWKVATLGIPAIAHEGYQADNIAARDKTTRARRAMERYHREHPHDPYVCNKLGALYRSTGDLARAERLLRKGLAVAERAPHPAPLLHELHYHLGLLHGSRGHVETAIDHYLKAIDQPLPDHITAGARFNLAALEQQRQNFTAAIDHFNRVIEVAPDLPQAHLNLGLAHRATGNPAKAGHHYREALRLNPAYADAHRNLGALLLGEGRHDEALSSFHSALEIYQKRDPAQATAFRNALTRAGVNLA